MARVLIALLIGLFALPAAAAAKLDSGVRGQVTISPTCGGPSTPGDDCGPKGFETRIRIRTLPDRTIVAERRTGKHGRFRVGLVPGSYRLTRRYTKDWWPECPRVEFEVKAHEFTRADLPCDSGLR
ncbi:MAG: hypothetical protein QOH38_324 [Thermoleophilaceae bacterium]|nr:hypothetical protein [Thermoleophilaceae bacterium]